MSFPRPVSKDTFTTFRGVKKLTEPKLTNRRGGGRSSVRLVCALKLVSVIHVWIIVFGYHHSVGELAASEGLHGFLTVCSRDILHKDLKWETKRYEGQRRDLRSIRIEINIYSELPNICKVSDKCYVWPRECKKKSLELGLFVNVFTSWEKTWDECQELRSWHF